jgi:hypothetical protein
MIFESRRSGGGHEGLTVSSHIACSTAVMESVPNEVLAEIFEAGTLMCSGLHDDLPFAHLVSSVCRKWRIVAIHSLRL